MESKEAVLELICEAKSVNCNDGRIYFLRETINKDLELLNIIKFLIKKIKCCILLLYKSSFNSIDPFQRQNYKKSLTKWQFACSFFVKKL